MSGEQCAVQTGCSATLRGFWLARWFQRAPEERHRAVVAEIAGLIAAGKLHAPIQSHLRRQRNQGRGGGRSEPRSIGQDPHRPATLSSGRKRAGSSQLTPPAAAGPPRPLNCDRSKRLVLRPTIESAPVPAITGTPASTNAGLDARGAGTRKYPMGRPRDCFARPFEAVNQLGLVKLGEASTSRFRGCGT
jgi:hypothetical protein